MRSYLRSFFFLTMNVDAFFRGSDGHVGQGGDKPEHN
jgi:hypothetical protein